MKMRILTISILLIGFMVCSAVKRAVVIGASSGMGREIAKRLSRQGYVVGVAARRTHLLTELQNELELPVFVEQLDASCHDQAVAALHRLIDNMGGVDLAVITISAFRDINGSSRDWKNDAAILEVDVVGFYALARTIFNRFEEQGYGHFVGISSIDGLRGIAFAPAYSAAKAFCSRYMQAERNYFMQKQIPVVVTDIIPGWVNSSDDPDFAKNYPNAYWIDSLEDVTNEIMNAIHNKAPVAYVTSRWKQVADMLHVMPDELYNALGGI